ncbi:MAG: response regulator [Spirochaetaceae bacterium]|nr:response regulator [Spirochaetaceae bacterium]
MTSDDSTIYDFNLTALLKLSELNIRRVAENNKKLTVGRYFKMLSQFVNLAPNTSDAIKEFAGDSSGIKDWKSIKDMITLFEEMRCETYIRDMNEIRNACGKGDHRVAAFHAEKIDHGFNNLYSQIMTAKITKEEDDFPKADSTLLSCLKVLDEKKEDHELLVLTVDDSPAILEAVAAVLSKNYKVFKLPKPAMLENVLKQVKPDLFLLDYQMPELNGFELIPIIRGFEEHKNTPIVFLTSEGTVDNLTAAMSLGACDFIVKPFIPDQLREKVAKHINSKNN